MKYFKEQNKYKVKPSYVKDLLRAYWFIPSDVLQRAIEANIWDLCKFTHPILSIGIGNGEVDSYLFKKHGLMDVGIDIDDSEFDTARSLGIYKNIYKVNAGKMPFKTSSFSTVISNSTFEHIKNDEKAISEVSRVLKAGGLFFLTTPSNFLQEWILAFEGNGKGQSEKKIKSFNKRLDHFHYHTLSEWEDILKSNKLELITHKYYFSENVSLYWYRLFKIFTFKINDKEVWSYLGHGKLSRVLPKKIIIKLFEKIILKNAFKNGFFTDPNIGGQNFLIPKQN